MKRLYPKQSDCCGCELCSQICPVSIIKMEQDDEGFYYPLIQDSAKCINCKLCEKVCPEKNRIIPHQEIRSVYTGFAKDVEDVKRSSSGGLATIISKWFIENEGVVYGVKYSDDCRSIIYGRAQTYDELEAFRGSKYAQSRKTEVYTKLKQDLENHLKVLFIGVPCDVSAVYNYTRNKYPNLFTVELICHGVTSPKVHQQYVDKDIEKVGKQLSDFSVRYKKDGWKPYYIFERFEDGETIIKPYRPTAYGVSFIYLKRPSCNECKFKLFNKEYGLQADMTIGDNHGVRLNTSAYNEWGSSVAFVHTEKGELMINAIRKSFIVVEGSTDLVRDNLALYRPFPKMINRGQFSKTFIEKDVFSACNLYSIKMIEAKDHVKDFVVSSLIKLFKRIGLEKYKSQCIQVLGLIFPKYQRVKTQEH